VGAAHECAGAATHHHDYDADDHDHHADRDDVADGHDQRTSDIRTSDIRTSDIRTSDIRTSAAADKHPEHHARTTGCAGIGRAWSRPVDAAFALTGTASDPLYTGVP
jgi:hypothetical protein